MIRRPGGWEAIEIGSPIDLMLEVTDELPGVSDDVGVFTFLHWKIASIWQIALRYRIMIWQCFLMVRLGYQKEVEEGM